MYRPWSVTIAIASVLLTVSFGCRNTSSNTEHGGGKTEEPGTRFGIDQTCDVVRNAVRLILTYDGVSAAFAGTAENVSDRTVPAVRVEVHLSNGTELGPTPRNDPRAGDREAVVLSTEGQSFEWWTGHAEVGAGEHGGEHGDGRGGEHAGEHSVEYS